MNIRDIPFPLAGGEYHYDGAQLTRIDTEPAPEAPATTTVAPPDAPRGKKNREG